MARKNWVRLDNASKIFVATMSSKDSKVFRITAELKDEVVPELLQEALDVTYEHFPLYHSVLRRGIFWYYLEDSDLTPKVQPDRQNPAQPLYQFESRNLLFRVLYDRQRVHLEVFHTLSDGTGALWFLENLLHHYILRRYAADFQHKELLPEGRESVRKLLDDSFARYFSRTKPFTLTTPAKATISTVTGAGKAVGKLVYHVGESVVGQSPAKERVYRVRGRRTPDNRMRLVEGRMPVKPVLALAKAQETTLTIYLMALYMLAAVQEAPVRKDGWTVAVTVPVNLRAFFPSTSARNFFSTIRVAYHFQEEERGEELLKKVIVSLNHQFSEQIVRERLKEKSVNLKAYEEQPVLRIMPRPVKDLILKILNAKNNQNLTLGISNLGRVAFHPDIDPYIGNLYAMTSAVRPQFLTVSHGETLTITWISPYVDTEIEKTMIRMLTQKGVAVTVAANRVDVNSEEEGESS